MSAKIAAGIVTALAALAGVLCLWAWLGYAPADALTASVPGMDDPHGRRPAAREAVAGAVRIGANFETFDGTPADIAGQWPRFRGADFDNVYKEDVRLADSWPDDGPPVLWSVELGEGYAGAAVRAGRVFVMDYDEQHRADALRCFSLADGREIWRRWYELRVKRNHGMSRTVPAVSDRYVVSMGPMCHVMCVDMPTGALRWGIDLQSRYGTTVPDWYTGQCPLIDGTTAVLAPAGTNVLMVGIDCETGNTVWQTPNPRGWRMSHSSVVDMSLGGRRTYVYAADGGVAGVAAEGEDRGRILWQTEAFTARTVAPSPLALDDRHVLLCAGYGAGSMLLRVERTNGTFAVQVAGQWTPREGVACEHHTPIVYGDHVFAVQPKDAGPLRKQFVCYPRNDCDTVLWSSGTANRFGLGPFMLADGKFLVMDDNGALTMLKYSTSGYIQLARARVLEGHDSWAPMALAGGRLLVRDTGRMVCLDLRAGQKLPEGDGN